MENKTRFLADEHVDIPAVTALKARGVDIISVEDANLRGCPDKDILALANKDQRVVVTRDKDFLRLARTERHCGIIFLTRSLNVGDLIREIEKIIVIYKPKDLENAVFYIPLKKQ